MPALAEQLDALLAELAAVQRSGDGLHVDALRRGPQREGAAAEDCDMGTRQIEALLARLYPIELAIMATPARTIADLGVKARHAAYVMSEQWDAPIDQLDWHAQTVRLLIEASLQFRQHVLALWGVECSRSRSAIEANDGPRTVTSLFKTCVETQP